MKKLCDFFKIDRSFTTTKDGLVDKLLDFLGAPHKNKLKGSTSSNTNTGSAGKGTKETKSTTKKTKPTKRAKTETKNNDEENEEEKDEEEQDDDENANDDDDYDDVDDDKLPNGDGTATPTTLPTKERLRKWVRAYVRCFHETKLTVNHALDIGSEKFGIDLLPMKADLKKLLIEEL